MTTQTDAPVCVDEVRACVIAVLAQRLVEMARLSHGTPRGREILERMRAPVIGDLVLVTMVLGRDDLYRRVGVLEAVRPDPLGGFIYVVRNVHEDPDTKTTWCNASCVALPATLDGAQTVEGLFLPKGQAGRVPLALFRWRSTLPPAKDPTP